MKWGLLLVLPAVFGQFTQRNEDESDPVAPSFAPTRMFDAIQRLTSSEAFGNSFWASELDLSLLGDVGITRSLNGNITNITGTAPPTMVPTPYPTTPGPTAVPTPGPTISHQPTGSPTISPVPTISAQPTPVPLPVPTASPTKAPVSQLTATSSIAMLGVTAAEFNTPSMVAVFTDTIVSSSAYIEDSSQVSGVTATDTARRLLKEAAQTLRITRRKLLSGGVDVEFSITITLEDWGFSSDSDSSGSFATGLVNDFSSELSATVSATDGGSFLDQFLALADDAGVETTGISVDVAASTSALSTMADSVTVAVVAVADPTAVPIPAPTAKPTFVPVPKPTLPPGTTADPSPVPIPAPTAKPVPAPTAKPVPAPTPKPVPAPTPKPVASPTLFVIEDDSAGSCRHPSYLVPVTMVALGLHFWRQW